MKPKTKKQQPPSNFWVCGFNKLIMVAHRGGDAVGVDKENSLKAFQAAYNLGYRWFETDVVPTRDRRLLAIHGRGYQRYPNADLPPRIKLQRLSYQEVTSKVKVGGESPILLSELMDSFKDCKFFVDPKTYKAGSVLAEVLIKQPDYISKVCVGSFLPFNSSRVRKLVLTATGENVAVSILGPLRNIIIRLAARISWLGLIAKYQIFLSGAESVHVPYKWITSPNGQKFLDFAHKLSLKVAVYTPNDKSTIEICRDKGTDLVMTDNVKLIKRI